MADTATTASASSTTSTGSAQVDAALAAQKQASEEQAVLYTKVNTIVTQISTEAGAVRKIQPT